MKVNKAMVMNFPFNEPALNNPDQIDTKWSKDIIRSCTQKQIPRGWLTSLDIKKLKLRKWLKLFKNEIFL